MQPSPELIDELFLDKVRAARSMDRGEKLLDGLRLFDWSCRIAKDGIRMRHPDASEERVNELLLEQLERIRRMEAMQ